MKHLESYELRELCIKNDWFTCGTIKQYEKLFDRNKEEASINELSIIILNDKKNAKESITKRYFKSSKYSILSI